MTNPYLGWNLEALEVTAAWVADLQQALTVLLAEHSRTRPDAADAVVILGHLEDALGDCRGVAWQIAAARREARTAADTYAREVAHALRSQA